MPTDSGLVPGNAPQLKRALGLSALIIYGIVLIQPTAPMPLFGAAAVAGGGHVVTAILIGMVAMLFTAISYGRMANAYPNAGSAYAYVSREIHPALGYFVGWSIIFDYVMNPIICVIWIAGAAMNLLAFISGMVMTQPLQLSHPITLGINALLIVLFTILFTVMNLRGIEASARTNGLITVGLCLIIVLFLGAAVRYLFLHPPNGAADWTRPFYNPETFSFHDVSNGAALAVLTYIGFDGVSTLSEEAHNPRRNILLATVLVCLITGVLASVQVYFAQLIWPDTNFPDEDNAFSYVAAKAAGPWLFAVVNAGLLVASIGSGAGAHLGAGRLLYSMGRDNAIPRKFFGVINPNTRIPSNNIILIGVVMLVAALSLKAIQEFKHVDAYGFGCVLLNFGALFAFMGVNIAAFLHYFVRNERKTFWGCVSPLLGFAICAYLWGNLGKWAIIVGFCWLATGVVYGAWRTSFFQRPIQFASASEEETE
ncbi:MAG TPA: APC family permease [Pseudomonadales bacterium]|nr:APC family permease [Pseudomonadales bacterium]